jgi:hypothetical protein
MKQLLDVTLTFEVGVDLPDEMDLAHGVKDLRTQLHTASLSLTRGNMVCPAEIVFRSEAVSMPFTPKPDEFRCDSCRREFSNDEKCIDNDGGEFCGRCAVILL